MQQANGLQPGNTRSLTALVGIGRYEDDRYVNAEFVTNGPLQTRRPLHVRQLHIQNQTSRFRQRLTIEENDSEDAKTCGFQIRAISRDFLSLAENVVVVIHDRYQRKFPFNRFFP